MIGNMGYERRLQALERRAREIGYGVPGLWSAWTPVLDQGGVVTATISHARFERTLNRVTASFILTATGAGTPGNRVVVTGLPASFPTLSLSIGSFTVLDAGTVWYAGSIFSISGPGVEFYVSGNASQLGYSPAYTIAAGDVISGTVVYETA
jgi:hypothetical protein